MRRRIFLFLFIFLILGGTAIAYFGYGMVMASNFKGEPIAFVVKEETTVDDIVHELGNGLIDPETFKTWADMRNLESSLKVGRYEFREGMSNRQMVNYLKAGLQAPHRIQFHNVKNFQELAEELASDMDQDSIDYYEVLVDDSFWEHRDVMDKNERWAYIIPNTYEIYYTNTPREVLDRLVEERDRFWNEERKAQAEKLGLTPVEVSILASIVSGETYMVDEMPTVAGLYLNRLERGIRLQCDATSKFAWEMEHPEDRPVRTVLTPMVEFIHPYNTYTFEGLPPGPISIPEIQAIEAVLNYEEHDYLFMMVDPDRVGYHKFARTNAEHVRNVNYYRRVRASRR